MPDLDALLHHLGLASAPPATLSGLRALHRAYASTIPYEALAVQLGEFEPLDVERIAARVLHGRGGYCFELNGLLGWLLERLGFAIERRPAVVGPPGTELPTNHLTLVVKLDGGQWLADSGLGEGPLEPIPLIDGVHRLGDPAFTWTVAGREDGGWWVGQHPWGSLGGLRIAGTPATFADFAPHHERLSTAPDSRFVRTLVVQRPYADRVLSLRARTLRVDGPRHAERRLLADRAELADVLRERFTIDPDRLGDERLERLWRKACAQHDDWSRRATSPPLPALPH